MALFEGLWRPVRSWLRPRAAIETSRDLLEHLLAGAGYENAAKIQLTPDAAMQAITVYACVRVIAETLGQTPLMVYRRTEATGTAAGGRERATDHPAWKLLHQDPNGWMTPFEFKRLLGTHVSLRGNFYAFKNMARGETRELLPIHPDRVKVEQDSSYNLRYTVLMGDSTERQFAGSTVMHHRALTTNGYYGLNPIQVMRQAVGLTIAAQEFGGRFFGNNQRPSGVLSTEQKLDDDAIALIKKTWQEAHGGENKLGTAVLDHGLKFEAMTVTNEDAQFLETRKFQRGDIAAGFRLPPHMVGDLDKASFSNIEQMSLEFVQYSMMPHFVNVEQRCNSDLIPRAERDDVYCEFLVDALLRGDMLTRSRVQREGIFAGHLTRNEARAMENRNPLPGLDDPLVPLNVAQVDESGETKPTDAAGSASPADVRQAEVINIDRGTSR